MIIGITGHKRHGKDTCGQYINSILNTDKVKMQSFAFAMKSACTGIFGWTPSFIEEHKEDIDPYYGISPRQVLQSLGTDFSQFFLPANYAEFQKVTGRNLWIRRLFRDMSDTNINIITDVRFKHEVDAIRNSGQKNVIIKVIRPSYPVDTTHLSELEVDTIEPDITLLNNDTLNSFYAEVYEFLKTIYGDLGIKKKVYISGPMTGYPNWNHDAFKEAEQMLNTRGFEAMLPRDMNDLPSDTKIVSPKEYKQYLADDIYDLLKCDAIYMLEGWRKSKGANLEKHVAQELGLAVYYQEKGDF